MSFWSRSRTPNILKDWQVLDNMEQLNTIAAESQNQTVAIFKHSTTCGISHMVKDGLESSWSLSPADIKVYYLDLLAHRDISNEVAKRFKVVHQSPQFIILKGGKVSYQASHHSISNAAIERAIR